MHKTSIFKSDRMRGRDDISPYNLDIKKINCAAFLYLWTYFWYDILFK